MEEQAQHLIDATTGLFVIFGDSEPILDFSCSDILAAFKAGKIASNPFAQPPPGGSPMGLPPRPGMPGFNPMLPPPIAAGGGMGGGGMGGGGMGGMAGFAPPNFAPPNFSMPPHAMNRPPMK